MKNPDLHMPIQNSKLKDLKPLLKEWQHLHEEYCSREKYDSLYWYNERANTSVLAGAAWKLDGFALEEFGAEKKYRRKSKKGRSDLWFFLNKKHYIVEAKQLWISLSNNKKDESIKEKIEGKLENAKRDAENTKNGVMDDEYEPYTLGIVFIVPYIKKMRKIEIDKRLKMLIGTINKNIEYDLMAYCFPNYSLYDEHYNYYPGVVLVISRVA